VELVFESVARDGVDSLRRARAALRQAERRVGVQHRDRVIPLVPPEPAPLTELLPEGDLPRGAAVAVRDSASLLGWLLGATQGDRWAALVGWPALGLVALSEAGVDLERIVSVPDVRGIAAQVLAALGDGFEIVVVGPRVLLTSGEQRRLLARARQRGTAILTPQTWEGAVATLDIERARWSGPDRGGRWIREAQLTVTRRSRADGAGSRFDVTRQGAQAPTVTAARIATARRTG